MLFSFMTLVVAVSGVAAVVPPESVDTVVVTETVVGNVSFVVVVTAGISVPVAVSVAVDGVVVGCWDIA